MASVESRTNRDGTSSFRVRWTSDTNAQSSRTFRATAPGPRAESVARRQAEAFALSVERGTAEPDGVGMTVAALTDRWLEAKAPRVTPSTLICYRQIAKDYVVPALGGLKLRQLTPLRLERWLSDQRTSSSSAATIHGRWSVLRAILRQAVRWRLMPYSPCDGVDAPPQGTARDRALSEAEVRRLLAAVTDSPLDTALTRVLVFGGLRIGEALALRWVDVDLDGLRITVGRTLSRTETGVRPRAGTKTHGSRVVPLDALTIEAMRGLRRERLRMLDGLGLPFEASSYAFATRPDGRVPNAEGVRVRLRAASGRAGMPAVRPHDLRRSSVSSMIRAGVAPSVVAARVGHKNLSMTLSYNQTSEADQRRAVEELQRAVEGEAATG